MGKIIVTDSATITVEDAERLTGISKKEVSRWRKRLENKAQYRDWKGQKRRAGQLLAEIERSQGKRTDLTSGGEQPKLKQVKRTAKISDWQAKQWQRLAKVPQEKFERKLGDATKKVSLPGKDQAPSS